VKDQKPLLYIFTTLVRSFAEDNLYALLSPSSHQAIEQDIATNPPQSTVPTSFTGDTDNNEKKSTPALPPLRRAHSI